MKGRTVNIIVIDDDVNVRDTYELIVDQVCESVDNLDYRIHSTDSGSQALEWINSMNVDLVVQDIFRPGLNGLELLKIIREKYPQENIAVVLVSGRIGSDVQEEELSAAGADCWVKKPHLWPDLEDYVKKLLERIH